LAQAHNCDIKIFLATDPGFPSPLAVLAMAVASWLATSVSSDEEQAMPLQAAQARHQRQPRSALFGLCTGGLLLVAIGVVGATFSPQQSMAGQPKYKVLGGQSTLPVLGLSASLQASAQKRVGRALTEREVGAIYFRVGRSSNSRVRSLLASKKRKEREEDLPVNLTDACKDGISEKLKDMVDAFAEVLIEAFFDCIVSDAESKECTAATDKIALFMDDQAAKCQVDGDFCNVTMTGMKEHGKKVHDDTLGVCVPVACHNEARQAVEYFQAQLDKEMREARAKSDAPDGFNAEDSESEEDCSNCTLSIECVQADRQGKVEDTRGKVEDALELKDAQHLSV